MKVTICRVPPGIYKILDMAGKELGMFVSWAGVLNHLPHLQRTPPSWFGTVGEAVIGPNHPLLRPDRPDPVHGW